jgi:hypothetical protein
MFCCSGKLNIIYAVVSNLKKKSEDFLLDNNIIFFEVQLILQQLETQHKKKQ